MRNSYATFAMLWKWYNTWKSIFEISIFLENRTLICQCGCSMVHKSHNNRWQILRNVFRKIDFWSISRAPIILKNPKTSRAGRAADNFLFLRKMIGPREKLQKSILIQKFFFSGVTLFSMVIVRHYIHHFTMNSMIFREDNFFQNLILTDYFPKNYYSRQFLFNAVHYYSIVTVGVG